MAENTALKVVYFASPAGFRAWLREHGTTAREIWVGFWRKDSGRAGLTYSEALDEALCHGWIDGIRKKIDALSYTNRFTPRKPRSHWSRVNLARVAALIRDKRMTPPGLAAYDARDPDNTARASFEQKHVALPPALEKKFRAQKSAWAFFQTQPPSYRRAATWWVASAKRDETQQRRFATLVADSADGRRLAQFSRQG